MATVQRRAPMATQPSQKTPRQEVPQVVPLDATWLIVSRAVALFLGALTLLTVLAEKRPPDRPARFGWIDLTPLPADLASGLLAFSGLLFVIYALARRWRGALALVTAVVAALLMAISLHETFLFLREVRRGTISSTAFVPLSLHVAACYAVVAAGARKVRTAESALRTDQLLLWGGFSFVACIVCFVIAQIYCVGKIDQRQRADVIVVFASEDGQLRSITDTEIEQRWEQALKLYKADYASDVLMVVAPETDVQPWQQRAEQAGIDRQHFQIQPLPSGDLQRAAHTIQGELQTHDWNNALLVTHFYQVPRLNICFWRLNQTMYPVPVDHGTWPDEGQHPLRSEIQALAREYLRPLRGNSDEI